MVDEFRKKPVVVEAIRLTWDNRDFVSAWCTGHYESDDLYRLAGMNPDGSLTIRPLEGVMRATPGDWIIRGVQGESYPRKSDIFEQTYERVED